ncbi:hypothetical protein U1Q18_008175 [Sarracenia purpurea var. burkii]
MPQVDLETLVSACAGGGSGDRKITCETLVNGDSEQPPEEEADVPPDFPPESFWLSKDAEYDWFDRNAFYERKESTRGNLNPAESPISNSSSQRFSMKLKSKASMIGLPKTQKTSYVDTTKRRKCKPPNIRLFPKRSASVGKSVGSGAEPSSPKVSCMGRVRSKRGRRKSSESATDEAAKPAGKSRCRGRRTAGICGGFMCIFGSHRRSKPAVKSSEAQTAESPARKSLTVKVREVPASAEPEPAAEPPSLGGMKRFASSRRPLSRGADDMDQRSDSCVAESHSSSAESGPSGRN